MFLYITLYAVSFFSRQGNWQGLGMCGGRLQFPEEEEENYKKN